MLLCGHNAHTRLGTSSAGRSQVAACLVADAKQRIEELGIKGTDSGRRKRLGAELR